MSQVRDTHRRAMTLLDEANLARMRGDETQAQELRGQAFAAEKEAAEMLVDSQEKEPTRSILFRSAAILALECEEYTEAERLIAVGLKGNPPESVAEQLRALQTRLPANLLVGRL
jgi:hypothetical protein